VISSWRRGREEAMGERRVVLSFHDVVVLWWS